MQLHIDTPDELRALRRYRQDSVGLIVAPGRLGEAYLRNYRGLRFNTSRYHRLLTQRTLTRQGSYYSLTKNEQTRYMLSELDIFRFIDIYQDTSQQQLRTHIRLQAYRKYALSSETGFGVSQGGLPSPFVSVSLKSRDFLRLLEVMEFTTRFMLQGFSTPTQRNQPYQNFEYSTQVSLRYPDILFPYFWKRKFRPSLMQRRTVFGLGLFISNRQDYQRYRNTFSVSYNWTQGQRLRYSFTFLDVNLISSQLSPVFRQQIRNFYNSFSSSFQAALSSAVSLQVTWNQNYAELGKVSGYRLRGLLETGGHLNKLYEDFAKRNRLEQYLFYKASMEYVHNLPTSANSNLVWRLHMGAAMPRGKNKSLPYEKYFL